MTTSTAQATALKITDFIATHRQDLIADTQKLLRFRTVSGGSPEQQAEYETEIPKCLEWLGELSTRMGFRFRVTGDIHGAGLVGEILWKSDKENAPLVVVASHIDVVTPVGDWSSPPFAAEIVDGVLIARGTQDDKGPLMQSLYGLWAVKECGIELPCDVAIVIGTLEETGNWSDMLAYFETSRKPDFAFTPDADFPIINGEKGMVTVLFEAEWDSPATHAETGLEFTRIAGGERDNIVPSRTEIGIRFPREAEKELTKELIRETTRYTAEDNQKSNVTVLPSKARNPEAELYELTISFIGKAAHASTPRKGHNAILDAFDFVKDIETFPEGVRHFAAFLYFLCQDMNGEALGIDAHHDFIGGTSVNLSIVDIRPNTGRASVNIRPTMGMTTNKVLEQSRAAADQLASASRMKVSARAKGEVKEAIFLDPENPAIAGYFAALRAGFEAVTGRPCELRSTAGTTYSKAIPNCCAFGPVLTPDEDEMAHQPNEQITVAALERNACIYGASLAMLAEFI
ncbi:MAG: Sapep family Mn(2+)-dependent dipeptidase [Sumerlaeia bacterium]